MSESNEDIKKMEARIAKLDEQQKQLKAKKRVLRNRAQVVVSHCMQHHAF